MVYEGRLGELIFFSAWRRGDVAIYSYLVGVITKMELMQWTHGPVRYRKKLFPTREVQHWDKDQTGCEFSILGDIKASFAHLNNMT